jgi:hypothetical protein
MSEAYHYDVSESTLKFDSTRVFGCRFYQPELIMRGVTGAPVTTGVDGGMNPTLLQP